MGQCRSTLKSTPFHQENRNKINVKSLLPSNHDGSINYIIGGSTSDEFICCGDDGKISWYNWNTASLLSTWQAHERSVNRIVYGIHSNSLYSCSRDKTICQWETNSLTQMETKKKQTFSGHTLTVTAISLNQEENKICSGSRDCCVRVWDIETGKSILYNQTNQNLVTCMQWISGEQLVVQGSEDLRLRTWDTRTSPLRPAQEFEGYVFFPIAVDVSSDGFYYLTSCKGFNGVGCEGIIWDRRTEKVVANLIGHSQDTTACKYLPTLENDNSMMAITASKDCYMKIWNSTKGELLFDHSEMDCGMFTSLATISSGKDAIVFASSFSGTCYVYKKIANQLILENKTGLL